MQATELFWGQFPVGGKFLIYDDFILVFRPLSDRSQDLEIFELRIPWECYTWYFYIMDFSIRKILISLFYFNMLNISKSKLLNF